MRIVEEKIYKFDELDEVVKNRLIEQKQQYEYECYMEYGFREDMVNYAKELVADYFSKDSIFDDTYYSLSYCQGDGAMIEFTTYTSVINEMLKGGLTYTEVKMIESYGDTITVTHNNSNYHNELCFQIDYESDYSYFTDENVEELETKIEKLIEKFKEKIIEMNNDLSNYGYKLQQDYECDSDYILEQLREDEYYLCGEVYYE